MSCQLQAAEPTLKSFRVGPGDLSVLVKGEEVEKGSVPGTSSQSLPHQSLLLF